MSILQMLYDSEINFEISCFWDAGFMWKLGDSANGYLAEGNARIMEDAITQLADAALKNFPESEFASRLPVD
jgi:hypothetical protein